MGVAVPQDSQPVASLRHENAVDRVTTSAQCCVELRGASAWWCGRGGGSGPLHGQPDGATAQSDCARFLAAGLELAQWLPESVETGASHHV